MDNNTGTYGIPKKEYSTIRLDGATFVGGAPGLLITSPPSYQRGDAFTVLNDPTIGTKIFFNKEGIYSVGAAIASSVITESLIGLYKPSNDVINPDGIGNINYTFEYLSDLRNPNTGNAGMATQIFYAKAGWYIQFVGSTNTPIEFFTILCKIA